MLRFIIFLCLVCYFNATNTTNTTNTTNSGLVRRLRYYRRYVDGPTWYKCCYNHKCNTYRCRNTFVCACKYKREVLKMCHEGKTKCYKLP